MSKIKQYLLWMMKHFIIFLLCGSLYSAMEILFKGAERGTHWTMFMLAGLSGMLVIDGLNNLFTYEMDFLLQVLFCTLFITVGEYVVGIIWNQNYEIWDYRNMPLNLNGQICLTFSLLWASISAIAIPLLDWIEWKVFKYKLETPPYYKILGKVCFQFK